MKAALIRSPAELSIRNASTDATLALLTVGTRVFDGVVYIANIRIEDRILALQEVSLRTTITAG